MAETAKPGAKMLLVTANVGSLFEDPANLWKIWFKEFFKTVETHKPQFLALHCQEMGGKTMDTTVSDVKRFYTDLLDCKEMKEYNRARVFIDGNYKSPEHFTALGSFYFLHESLEDVFEYCFEDCRFRRVFDKIINDIDLDSSSSVQKEKFPSDFFDKCKSTRKGFMRTRWRISNRDIDLINIHLFHDAHNVIAWEESPSFYAGLRRKALSFVLERLTDEQHETLPFFLFGDFNFRLDARPLYEYLCPASTLETITSSQEEVDKLIFRESENDRKVLLEVEKKTFNYANPTVFEQRVALRLLRFDKELKVFNKQLDEMEITFPPTYPYMEDVAHVKQYNPTRCPAWCDRILMSPSAQSLIAKPGDRRDEEDDDDDEDKDEEDKESTMIVYDNIGPNVCMGDHKPIFLSFRLLEGEGNLCSDCSCGCCVVQ